MHQCRKGGRYPRLPTRKLLLDGEAKILPTVGRLRQATLSTLVNRCLPTYVATPCDMMQVSREPSAAKGTVLLGEAACRPSHNTVQCPASTRPMTPARSAGRPSRARTSGWGSLAQSDDHTHTHTRTQTHTDTRTHTAFPLILSCVAFRTS